MKVVLASKNKHKLVEISKITEKFGFELCVDLFHGDSSLYKFYF